MFTFVIWAIGLWFILIIGGFTVGLLHAGWQKLTGTYLPPTSAGRRS